MAHSSHKRWRGCCPQCKPEKHKSSSDTLRTPFRELRKLGIKRRYNRNQV